jgi:hypothetical protein
MSKRTFQEVNQDMSLGKLFETELPILSKGNEGLQSSPHVYDTGHEGAVIETEEFDLPSATPFLPAGAEKQTSYILKEFYESGQESFTYQNETKVQNLVASCLKDALLSQDLSRVFSVENEFSVFSYRPDIIVVSHDTKGIILIIEVKKPGAEVFESHEVSGQEYDYLVGNLLSGVHTPFAVLSSYDEMCIAYLDDDGVSRKILERNAEKLGEDISPEILEAFGVNDKSPSSASPVHQSVSEKPSPEPKLNKVFGGYLIAPVDCKVGGEGGNDDDEEGHDDDDNGDDGDVDDDDDDDDDDGEWDRIVIYTQTFGRKDAMKALVLAIRCGLESVALGAPRNIPMGGETAVGTCAKVNETGFVWTSIPGTIKFNYDNFPGNTTKMMYLWRDLGRGSKGRVFLACNASGRACAVKFFLIDYNTYHRQTGTQEERQTWRAAQMADRLADAEKEKDYWIRVYGKEFEDQVRVTQLNNLWCLMMPYFDQVLDCERENYLKNVESRLTHFKEMNLRYNMDDVRWRHVGVRNGLVYIFDLGSLDECHASEIDVGAQVDKLRRKIQNRD